MSYLLDETTRHYLGMSEANGYFTVVAPHEVAHQWWDMMWALTATAISG